VRFVDFSLSVSVETDFSEFCACCWLIEFIFLLLILGEIVMYPILLVFLDCRSLCVSEVLSVWGCCSSLFPSSAICLAPVSRMTIVFCDQPRHCLCCVDTHTYFFYC
jgi:hypothetical protein